MIHQRVQVTLSHVEVISSAAIRRKPGVEPATIEIDSGARSVFPHVGVALSDTDEVLSDTSIQRLRALHLAHLRVDLRPDRGDYEPLLHRAARESRQIGAPLEIAVFLSDRPENELKKLRSVLDRLPLQVARWLVFQESDHTTSERGVQAAREFLLDYHPSALIGGGTDANFAELNRSRLPLQLLDFLTYSLNPQVHAFDDVSLVENLKAQTATVDRARALAGKLPVMISPVTLKPRFNAVATGAASVTGRLLPEQVDPRQASLFGAGWTVGSLRHLCASGVVALTYYETIGWRGLMESESDSPLPGLSASFLGGVFPMYHVFADVGEFAGGYALPSESSSSRIAEALVLSKNGSIVILLANLTTSRQTVRIVAPGVGGPIRVRSLDEETANIAITIPDSFRLEIHDARASGLDCAEFDLSPLAVVRLEGFGPSE